MTYDKNKFCERIQELMKRLGVKKNYIVTHSHYNRRTLTRHLDPNDPSLPKLDDLVALSCLLNTSLDYLCYGRGIQYVSENERDKIFTIMEMFSNEEHPEYAMILQAITHFEPKQVGHMADFFSFYERFFDAKKS